MQIEQMGGGMHWAEFSHSTQTIGDTCVSHLHDTVPMSAVPALFEFLPPPRLLRIVVVMMMAGLLAPRVGGAQSIGSEATAAPARASQMNAGATLPPESAAAPASGASAAAATAKSRPPTPAEAGKPFAEVVKEAQCIPGLLPVWRKDDRAWIEIPVELLNQPLLFSVNISQSAGERGLYAGQMGPNWLMEFRRTAGGIQLLARNTDFRPGDDPALQRTVSQSFSDSLLAAVPLASAPHPERKSVLIDASFLLGDLMSYSTALEMAYRLPFGLDRSNSSIEAAKGADNATSINVRQHYVLSRLPSPAQQASSPGGWVMPSTLPDPRSFFVGVVYNFRKLPEQPMRSRVADGRIGHFNDAYHDYSHNPKKFDPKVYIINRWRLEKKDPAAELSEPVQPIVYWLDQNIPERYRAAVTAGVLEWNKAFERIGFKNAIEVRQQPQGADFDTLDANHASIRWYIGSDASVAVGPRNADPRSGEIIDADIALADVFSRSPRQWLVENDVSAPAATPVPEMPNLRSWWTRDHSGDKCHYASEAAQQMHFALDILEARGELTPDSPEAEAFVQSVLKETIMHEVGHTLGLKHNFRASTVFSPAHLRNPVLTAEQGISGSVMDYNAYNLPLRGEPRATMVQPTLGPYDYWAIEYAYKPLPPEQEAEALERIASRSHEPGLAFADDADVDGPNAVDPRDNRHDLGSDPLGWSQRKIRLARELWTHVQNREPQPGDDLQRARRGLVRGFRHLQGIPEILAKHVGGMSAERPDPKAPGRPLYRPIEPARQREALRVLTSELFDVSSFRFKPEFLASMAPEYREWGRSAPVSIPSLVLQYQTQALTRIFNVTTVQRVLDTPNYLPPAQRASALRLEEVFQTLQDAIWKEARNRQEVELMRRNLQREHMRLMVYCLRNPDALPADGVSLLRWHAVRLQAELKNAAAQNHLSVLSRAHYVDSLKWLSEALSAGMTRN